jgi:hypothetical protein
LRELPLLWLRAEKVTQWWKTCSSLVEIRLMALVVTNWQMFPSLVGALVAIITTLVTRITAEMVTLPWWCSSTGSIPVEGTAVCVFCRKNTHHMSLRRIMFTIRMFLEVLVRNVIVARAILTCEDHDRKLVLVGLENLTHEHLAIPASFQVTVRVIKSRPASHYEAVINDIVWTGNEVNTSTHRSDKAWVKCNQKVERQQKISAENKLNHGNFKGASNGSHKQQAKKGIFTS